MDDSIDDIQLAFNELRDDDESLQLQITGIENIIGSLAKQLSDSNYCISQLESKVASLENDIYSLQIAINRLEGI